MARPRGLMELFKFACYVGIPISMMVVFANNPDNLEKIIRNRQYVVYPPEGPRPPSGDEMAEIVKKNRDAHKDKP
ncbi:hypothetical protein KFL_001470230 [Klebsormidium nitens]|uniref:Uncharacterized protein n=1 Tax=Klebsormidium nitens TaxID=105231 RepID=A0A1Y1I3W4_KLENI|nr:hypothetical protein KFL_001470230 [Klebsormidium nitens]|eukprot:GAQ83426.1 hypothetical protein KFL_001470230 [Klebsormidium nitens]